ncbi:hypothetical protein, partial [Candidatus Glomeribacter gigasporarum]
IRICLACLFNFNRSSKMLQSFCCGTNSQHNVTPLSSQSVSSVQENEPASDTGHRKNVWMMLIQRVSEMRDLSEKLMWVLDSQMEAQNAETRRLTDAASHVSTDQARLKDDALWNWEEDEEFLKYLKDPRIKNIEIEGMPLEKWLKGKTETREIAEKVEWNDWDPNPVHWNKKHGSGLSEGLWNQLGWTVKNVDPAHQERGLPKYLVLQLQQKLSGEAIASKDVGSKQQTQLQQVTQESINESNMVSNLNKTLFSLLSAIIANLRT